ncbi:MAG TPA: ribonuclease HI family protein [Candidatus Methylomirabilis sp.]|nr:ribonuclease HI family protein [Candidatus Methylomirabilis sp.]
MNQLKLNIYTDGGARGNPGPAGIGVVIENADTKEVLEEHSQYLGETTNNQAEYKAVLLGLTRAVEMGATAVTVIADSELLVRQATGEYKVKNPGLAMRFLELRNLEVRLGHPVRYRHIRREQNTHADSLANKAMDEGSGTKKSMWGGRKR